MRTKALIGAAIAMAAGILSASAQVYSVNVVGYVNNTVTNTAAGLTLWATPLDDGTNNITDLLATAPNGTKVESWTGSAFSSVTRSKINGNWPTNAYTHLPPGTGYFIQPVAGTTLTNVFVGQVACAPGGGQTNVSLTAGLLVLAGSKVPFSGLASDSGTNTLNLASMPNGTKLEFWSGTAYSSYTKSKINGNWPAGMPTINVGEGFFLQPSSNVVWTQTLQ